MTSKISKEELDRLEKLYKLEPAGDSIVCLASKFDTPVVLSIALNDELRFPSTQIPTDILAEYKGKVT